MLEPESHSMLRLMLLRHAKSDWSKPGEVDHDRDLNKRGRETAPRIGHYIAGHGLSPDHVLCSTAQRARTTWELVATELDVPPQTVFERRLYNAAAQAVLDLVRATENGVRTLLVVGHNPGLQDLAGALIASGNLDHRERLSEKLPTGALVVIDFALDKWTELHPQAGRLERFIAPRGLETATE
jgi:phosphohistidine phosphatase